MTRIDKPVESEASANEKTGETMVQLIERPNETPICPHCETPVETLYFQLLSAFLGRRYIYFCSACKKVLGISHRKGFFMG